MITYKEAKKLLPAGDVIYLCRNGRVLEAKVIDVLSDSIKTELGYISLADHGTSWFLTRKGCVGGG